MWCVVRFGICDPLRDLVSFVQFKNRKNIHGGVFLLVKLQAKACNFTKSNTPPWVFLTFFMYKWYQIAQRVANMLFFHRYFSVIFKKQYQKTWSLSKLFRFISTSDSVPFKLMHTFNRYKNWKILIFDLIAHGNAVNTANDCQIMNSHVEKRPK